MSRHRIVRSMNYEDEYYDDEDEYSRSVEDNYCISPSTAAQFTWNREKNVNFSSYMNSEEVIDEGDEDAEDDDVSLQHNSLSDSSNSARLQLSEIEQAKLNSCLEEARNILGESTPESVLVDVIIENQFNLEPAVDQLLSQQDRPKPQREPRQRKDRSQDDKDADDLDILLKEINADKVGKFTQEKSSSEDIKQCYSHMVEQGEGSAVKKVSMDPNSKASGSSISSTSQQVNVSLADLAKKSKHSKKEEQRDPKLFRPSNLSTKSSVGSLTHHRKQGENIPTAESLSFSLSQMAKERKELSKPILTNIPMQSGDFKFPQNMTNLSALVAQHSAKKTGPPSSGKGSNLNHKISSSILPKGFVELSSEQRKMPSLANLIQAHADSKTVNSKLAEKSADTTGQLTLTQLAEKHRKSTNTEITEVKSRTQEETAAQLEPGAPDLSVSSLLHLQKLSLGGRTLDKDNTKIKNEQSKSHHPSQDFSLSNCLKTSKPRKTSRKDIFSSFSIDLKENLDIGMSLFSADSLDTEQIPLPSPVLDSSLISQASSLGLVLCSTTKKRKSSTELFSPLCHKKIKRYSKFTCHTQVSGRTLYKDIVLQNISPFDFGTMSPDDIVRQKQKQAFTRSDKEFTV